MKFHEAVKYVTENPEAKVEHIYRDGYKAELSRHGGYFNFVRFDGQGNSVPSDLPGGGFSDNVPVHSDWQPVRQSVPFMEAFNAWQKEDKEIYCEMDGRPYQTYEPSGNYALLQPQGILKGKWYIVD